MNLDLNKVFDVEVEDVHRFDYPDFCDAYISKGWIEIEENEKTEDSQQFRGTWYRPLTEAELDYINDNCGEFVNQKALDSFN